MRADPPPEWRLHFEALEAELGRFRARVEQLEEALGFNWQPPLEFGLTVQEGRLLALLLARPQVTKDAAMAALYRDFGRDEPEIKIVDVFICKLRKKLKPFGVLVETIWGRGYAMSAEMKARVAAMVPPEAVAA